MPSETTTRAAAPPGRCRLASASRISGRDGLGARRAAAATGPRGEAEQREGGERAAEIPQREAALRRAQHDRRGQRKGGEGRRGRRQRGQTARRRRYPVAPQRAGRDAADRGQRPQRKDQRRQHAAQRREAERPPIHRDRQRGRQQSREQRSRKQRRGAAQHQADRDADQRKRQDLQQIGGEDEAGRGAEAFQRRDRLGLARDVSGDGVADPDAADEQRGDAGQAEKKSEPVEQSLQRWRCLGTAAQAPAGLRKGGAGPFDPGSGIAAFRHPDPVFVIDQRSGAQQSGPRQRRPGDQDARTERQAARRGVGQAVDQRRQAEDRLADAEIFPRPQPEPGRRGRLHDGAKHAVILRQRLLQGRRERAGRAHTNRCRA